MARVFRCHSTLLFWCFFYRLYAQMYELPGVYPGRCMYHHTFLLIEQTTLKKKQRTTHATERRRL